MASAYAEERQEQIASIIAAKGRVVVAELSQQFAVTAETVRRDLDALEAIGAIRRVHGGAIAPERASLTETSFQERETINRGAKQRIAERALDIIGEGFTGSVLIDAGSTTAELAKVIAARATGHPACIANSLQIATMLAGTPSVDFHLVGGQVRSITSAAVGTETITRLATLRPDFSVLGTNGLDAEFGLSTPDPLEAAVKTAMVQNSQRRILLADSTKFDTITLVKFADLEEIDVLVTNEMPAEPLRSALQTANVKVILA